MVNQTRVKQRLKNVEERTHIIENEIVSCKKEITDCRNEISGCKKEVTECKREVSKLSSQVHDSLNEIKSCIRAFTEASISLASKLKTTTITPQTNQPSRKRKKGVRPSSSSFAPLQYPVQSS